MPQETFTDQFKDCVASLTTDNGLGFLDANLTAKGRNHNDALHAVRSFDPKGVFVDFSKGLIM